MQDDQLNRLRRCTEALGQVLTLGTMSKKTESALTQVYTRMLEIYTDPPVPQVGKSVTGHETNKAIN